MADVILLCDQAIFTSIRTPTGEGYRIIAASRDLKPIEQQAITRSSPSHDALCLPDDENELDTFGASFYRLPTGRLCVAYSCFAGVEHTGRGGKRVYTHNIIVDEVGFTASGYNPFAILRAMDAAGLHAPTLKPKNPLPQIELTLDETDGHALPAAFGCMLTPEWRRWIVDALLDGQSLIVNLTERWTANAEAFLLALPGPIRADLSFGAGLHYSMARAHRLSFVHDDPNVVKSKSAGHNLVFVDPSAQPAPDATPSAWASFVDRHWQHDAAATLAERTSQPFTDVSVEACQRVAGIYDAIDRVDGCEVADLLDLVGTRLVKPENEIEARLTDELLLASQRAIREKLNQLAWDDVRRHWHAIGTLWRQSAEGCRFAVPLLETTLELAGRVHPLVAAEIALDLVHDVPTAATTHSHLHVIERVLTRLTDWAIAATDEEIEAIPALCERWRAARPRCEFVERLVTRCAAMSVDRSTTN